MRALLVELLAPEIQSGLFSRGGFQFCADVPMQSFVAAVVLRMAWGNPCR
jgi:hypothetical protein